MSWIIQKNVVEHSGIKGQKWGVRNGPPYPLKYSEYSKTERSKNPKSKIDGNSETNPTQKHGLTDGQKKALKIGAAAVGIGLATIGTMYVYKELNRPLHMLKFEYGTIKDLSSFSDKSVTLKTGTKFQRISSKSFEDYANTGKEIYASHTFKDKMIYKAEMPLFIKEWYRKGIVDSKDSYVHTLTANKPIKVASERDVAKVYMKITNSNEIDSGKFTRFTKNLVNRDNADVKAFYNEIRRLGFNAVPDLNDTASGYTKSPVILVNSLNDVKTTSVHKLGTIERVLATTLR